MEFWLWILVAVLLIIIVFLTIKICLMKKSAQEISEAFLDRLTEDTNTLIDISSRDRHMRELAREINIQLNKLKEERHRFQQGDRELKDAVTNISHDIRTPLTAVCGYLDLLDREEKSEDAARYLKIIRSRTEILRQLTRALPLLRLYFIGGWNARRTRRPEPSAGGEYFRLLRSSQAEEDHSPDHTFGRKSPADAQPQCLLPPLRQPDQQCPEVQRRRSGDHAQGYRRDHLLQPCLPA